MFLDLNDVGWEPDPPNVDEAEVAMLAVAAQRVHAKSSLALSGADEAAEVDVQLDPIEQIERGVARLNADVAPSCSSGCASTAIASPH